MIRLKDLSDDELLRYAAKVNAKLRQARRLKEAGDVIIRDNIQLWANAQGEISRRANERMEAATAIAEGQDK